jgi:hypothetical protein
MRRRSPAASLAAALAASLAAAATALAPGGAAAAATLAPGGVSAADACSLSAEYTDREGRHTRIVDAAGALTVFAVEAEDWGPSCSGSFDAGALAGSIDFANGGGLLQFTAQPGCKTLTFENGEEWTWTLPAPPGCHVAPSGDTFCFGMTLALAPCNMSDQAQHFWTAPSPGWILHDSQSSNEAISEWLGNNVGWPSALTLAPLDAAQPSQRWFEANRSDSDDTVIANENDIGANMSSVTGCRQWAVENPATPVAGAAVRPVPCDATAPTGRSFGFDDPGVLGGIQLLLDPSNASSYSGLCVGVDRARTAAHIVDDGAGAHLGAVADGVGITVGEGAARLLLDYEANHQGQMLSLLFEPGVGGAAVQALKLEIGGDGNVVQGATPSHEHYAGEAPVLDRGAQGWLAAEARKRNPAIILYALPWSFPGWLRQGGAAGATSPLVNPAATAAYVVDWVAGMVERWSVLVDVVGVLSDNWDPILSPAYVLALRAALDARGFASVQIECADSSTGWSCADQAVDAANPNYSPGLLAAVSVFGGHGVPAPGANPAKTGAKLWLTHAPDGGISDLLGAAQIANTLNEAYLNGNISASFVWAGVTGVYDGFPEYNQGLIRANAPMSGAFYVTPQLWAVAHTSAFMRPGWRHLVAGSGSGALERGGTFVTRMAADGSGAWSMVLSKAATRNKAANGAIRAELATFVLRGAALRAAQASGGVVFIYGSLLGGTGTFANVSTMMLRGNASVFLSGDGSGDYAFEVFVNQNEILTVTTDSSFMPLKGKLVYTTPAPTAFPTSVAWNWASPDTRAAPLPARWVVDVSGSFEHVVDPVAGRGVQQRADAYVPSTRYQTDTVPHAVVGDETWADIDVAAPVWLPSESDGALLGVRCSGRNDGTNNHVSGMDFMPGLWLAVNASSWRLFTRLDASAVVLGAGAFAVALPTQSWIELRLVARGSRLVARAGAVLLASVDVAASGAPRSGFVGIGAQRFGAHPIFGGLRISAFNSTCSAAPQEGHLMVIETCQADAAGQMWSLAADASGRGQIVSVANASLCVMMNGTDDAGFMGDASARAVFVAACNASEPRQVFLVEHTADDGPFRGAAWALGPVQGTGGLTLNIRADDAGDNEFLCGYPWQGSSNAWWSVNENEFTYLYAPYYGVCLTSCDSVG